MRNLTFERQWTETMSEDGLSCSVLIVSRAANDEGIFIVSNETCVLPFRPEGVRHAKMYMLDRCERDERRLMKGDIPPTILRRKTLWQRIREWFSL